MVHIPTLYFYKPVNGSSGFFNPQELREALSRALVPFYHMAGRLEKDENDRMSILCNAEGVLFVEAETSSTVDEMGGFTPHSEKLQFIPEVDRSSMFSCPLLLSQFRVRGRVNEVPVIRVYGSTPAGFSIFIRTLFGNSD
uniref:Uncharacterized protein n=1 Tax=Salix viminalis TaxID=40686 RepID=A0A6N2KTG3_SALVM